MRSKENEKANKREEVEKKHKNNLENEKLKAKDDAENVS